jgi:1,2-diacylglycerol 3-beta-glucosyltransferase
VRLMLQFIDLLLILVIMWLWLPNLIDLSAAVTLARRRGAGRSRSQDYPARPIPYLVFLVPAHNEELLITQCVRSLVAMDYPAKARRIIVIADNSTDGTARLAREAGADCMERFDTVRRGKPHALAWAIQQLPLADVDACVIVDADTAVANEFAKGLAAISPLGRIAAQAYIGTLNEWDNWLTRLAGLLARCRYDFTYVLRDRAGLNCPLTGNGMCIGARLLEANGWQAFSLTENWELYARYTAEGFPVRFAPGARLFTQQVRSMRQGKTQRSRWAAGRAWVLREWGTRIVRSRHSSALNKFATLAELAALSPVLHLSAVAAIISLTLFSSLPGRWSIAGAALASLASNVIATATVLMRHPDPAATVSAFARLPVYAVWRVSVAVRALVIPSAHEWRKTERHSA